jgi:hypothetical protein
MSAGASSPRTSGEAAALDDFAACGLESAEGIAGRFIPSFYFGCEADDPWNAMAFQDLWPFGARPRAIFSSDIGHWDVPDMREVLEEAWELVEGGALSAADFREFTFENPTDLLAGSNPDFFRGTAVEGAVAKYLGEKHQERSSP